MNSLNVKNDIIETKPLISRVNHLTGFYVIATLAFKKLIHQVNFVTALAIVANFSLNSLNIRSEIWWRFLFIILLLLLLSHVSVNKPYVKVIPEPVNPQSVRMLFSCKLVRVSYIQGVWRKSGRHICLRGVYRLRSILRNVLLRDIFWFSIGSLAFKLMMIFQDCYICSAMVWRWS